MIKTYWFNYISFVKEELTVEYVDKLKVGDAIVIFSSSSPITYLCPKRFERSKKYLQDKGFKII